VSGTPVVLVRLAADMARYRLYDDGVPDTVRQRYEDAVSLLKRMASGEVQVAGSTVLAVSVQRGVDVASRSPAQVFTPGVLAGY
jgi:phage gp36-like protein